MDKFDIQEQILILMQKPDWEDISDESKAKWLAVLIEVAGWKSPEQVYNQTMEAKRSGWDDCLKWHKAQGYRQCPEPWPVLTDEEMKAINDAQPSEAKYGDVFRAIAEAQVDAIREVCHKEEFGKRRQVG